MPAVDEGDPESVPPLPSATLAAAAAPGDAAAAAGQGYPEIWALSWPVMLSQVLANSVSLIDVAMVGRLGPEAVAAVGYAGQFFALVQSVLFAVSAACIALVARAIGAGEVARARGALAASIATAGGTAGLLAAAVAVAPRALLRGLGADPGVIEQAVPYLLLLLVSALLLAPSMMFESALRASRDARTPMQIALVVTGVKVALNALLIFGTLGVPRLGLVGAGIATLVAQVAGLVLFARVVRRARRGSALALGRRDFRSLRDPLASVVRLALPGIGERLAMNLGLLAYFRVLAHWGTVAIAAYTVGVRLLAFSWIPGTGLGVAAATLVGQALGAGDASGAARTGWRTARLALGTAVVLGVVGVAAHEALAGWFVADAATRAALAPFLLCLAITQPMLQTHFALAGAHRGAGDTVTPLLAAAIGNWALRLPFAVAIAAWNGELVWVWWALSLDHLARVAWLAWSFRRGRWRRTGAL